MSSVPHVNNVVLVVPSVQVHVIGVDQQEPKQDEQDLQGVLAPIHIVSVEDIGFLGGRQTILHGSSSRSL